MARARKKAPSTRRGGAPAPAARPTARAKSRKPAAAVAEVEVVEEEKGMGMEDGIVLMTSVTLVAAIILVEIALQRLYGAGAFG